MEINKNLFKIFFKIKEVSPERVAWDRMLFGLSSQCNWWNFKVPVTNTFYLSIWNKHPS